MYSPPGGLPGHSVVRDDIRPLSGRFFVNPLFQFAILSEAVLLDVRFVQGWACIAKIRCRDFSHDRGAAFRALCYRRIIQFAQQFEALGAKWAVSRLAGLVFVNGHLGAVFRLGYG